MTNLNIRSFFRKVFKHYISWVGTGLVFLATILAVITPYWDWLDKYIKTTPAKYVITIFFMVFVMLICMVVALSQELWKRPVEAEQPSPEEILAKITLPIPKYHCNYKRKLMKVEKEIFLDGTVKVEARVELIATDVVDASHHIKSQIDERGTTIENYKFELLEGFSSVGEITYEEQSRTLKSVHNVIRFSPPLKRDDYAHYRYKETYENVHLMYLEEILEKIKAGKIIVIRPSEGTNYLITAPTEKLQVSIVFPERYEVKPFYDVCYGHSNLARQEEEYKRIKEYFKAYRKFNRWYVEFEIPKPEMGLAYHLKWEPPTKEKYEKLIRPNTEV